MQERLAAGEIPETSMPFPPRDAVPPPKQTGQPGCLSIIARLIWVAGGNFVLLILMAFIVQQKTAFSSLDVIFWVVVAALLFIRFADIRWLHGTGSESEPATMKDWARYARLLLLIAGGVWAIAHALLLLLRR
jgi:hypothetical protein